MPDINAQVLGVSGRAVKTGTIYDIAMSDGNKYSTFTPELATKAQGLTGQNVTARVEITQNGNYTNYTLQDIAPAGQLPAAALPSGVPTGNTIPISVPSSGGGGGMSPERETKIVKQSLLATAFNFVGHLYTGAGPEGFPEATAQALSLAKELYGQVMGGAQAPPTTPAAVAAVVNAEVPGAVVVGAEAPPAQQGPEW